MKKDAKKTINETLDKFGFFEEIDKKRFDLLSTKLFGKHVQWRKTDHPEFPFDAKVDDATWKLRINEFPEEEMYTLLINDKAVLSFSDLPPAWEVPKMNMDMDII